VWTVPGFSDHEVKCAGCRNYFRLDGVRQKDNAYYCRKCYENHRSSARERATGTRTCPVCDRELTPYDQVIREGGFSYCQDCYNRVAGEGRNRDAAADRKNHCSVCGKALIPGETRVCNGSNSYCIACYDKSSPYLDAKPFRLESGDAIAPIRTGEKVACGRCRRDIGPLDVSVHEGRTVYCESCYRGVREDAGNRRFYLAEQAGISTRPGTTSLRNPENIVECDNCGHVVTRDRLETFPKNARGKLRCPRCNKPFIPAGPQAPGKAKKETAKHDKTKAEDFAVIAQLFKCLGDPCRVKIIESLSEKELCVFEFVDLTGFQYSAISYHLKMLKEMGLIQSYERGNFMVYSLTDKGQIVHEFIEKSKGLN
jgi:ArsR family transcriptional regulator